MKRISIEHAQPGHILAQKITRGDGALLAGQGTEVTEGLLKMLSRMNIDTIVIEEENKLSPEELEEMFQARAETLDLRFGDLNSQPILSALKVALINKAREERDEALEAMIPEAVEEGETCTP